jgi:hypothetical protein
VAAKDGIHNALCNLGLDLHPRPPRLRFFIVRVAVVNMTLEII